MFVQEIEKDGCKVTVMPTKSPSQVYQADCPSNVWKKIGKLANYDGKRLFGIEHNLTKVLTDNLQVPFCTLADWNNEFLLQNVYQYHLKKRIKADINWRGLLQRWQDQGSHIIELTGYLKDIYPIGYIINERELTAWRCMLRHIGCTSIIPCSNRESKVSISFCDYKY